MTSRRKFMRVAKSIDKMLREIKFRELGEYQIIQGDNPVEQIFSANDAVRNAHNCLNRYYNLGEELIANAVLRGNNRDPFLMASVKVLLGKKGWILRIRDSGTGFDVDKVLKTGEHQGAGQGLRHLKETKEIQFNDENNGSTLNIMGFYESKLLQYISRFTY